MLNLFTRSIRRNGYSLIELMVALAVFAVGASIAYPLLVSDINLYTRNFSLNKSNNSLRYSLQTLKRDIDMSVDPPHLMSYRTSGNTGILKSLPTANSAQAILMWVNLGPAYDMGPAPPANGGTAGPITPATGISLTRHIDAIPSLSSPVPQLGDRLMIMSPSPTSAAMVETVSMDGVSMQKPGRTITAVNIPATDTTTATFTVNIDQSNTALPAGITGGQSVYIIREVAYVANTVTDANGNAIERQLLYYPTTHNMTKANILIHDLDPTPQELDTNVTPAAIVQPFNYYGGWNPLAPLNVILPIRAVDYAHALADRNLGAATTDTSSTEFNVYLRSNPQLAIKVKID